MLFNSVCYFITTATDAIRWQTVRYNAAEIGWSLLLQPAIGRRDGKQKDDGGRIENGIEFTDLRLQNKTAMKKQILLSGFIFLSVFVKAQNIPQCDSLVINCCDFDTAGPNTLTIYVSNPSSVLFDYPGFALLGSNLDTIAKETVNYFGIGTYPQAHTMDIVAPLTLPFAGYLDLYVLFYDTLACRFAFTIADTVTGMPPGLQKSYGIKVFPNPAVAEINIRMDGFLRNISQWKCSIF
ncbi:MAG TPA: hypothetical protein VE978_01060 [Chitinophagales bacterium]|nr:hypothetical protein [Chitinophagales bacterium]